MDQTELVKKALGRIKKLAQSSTAERFKKKAAAKSAPPAKAEPVAEVEAEEDLPDVETPEEDADEVEKDPEDIAKKTTLMTIVRSPKKSPVKDSFPTQTKRKPGRPKKA